MCAEIVHARFRREGDLKHANAVTSRVSSSPALGSALLPKRPNLYSLSNVENSLPEMARSVIVVDIIHHVRESLWMSEKLSEEWSKLIHRMGREREDRIIGGETKLTVTAIFLIDGNWKVFKEHREIIGKPLRQEEIEEVEKMLRCKDPRYGFATYICLGYGTQKIIGFSCNGRLCTYCGYRHAREYAERLADRLLDLPYRFFTFTIPAGLRSPVNQNAELLKVNTRPD